MPIGKVWIYRLLCFCLFVFFSPARIILAALNYTRRFTGVLGRKSLILGDFAPPEDQNRTNRNVRWPRRMMSHSKYADGTDRRTDTRPLHYAFC